MTKRQALKRWLCEYGPLYAIMAGIGLAIGTVYVYACMKAIDGLSVLLHTHH